MNSSVVSVAARAKKASSVLLTLTDEQKSLALNAIADALSSSTESIERANAVDLRNCTKGAAFSDRLAFNANRIKAAAEGLRLLASAPDPVGRIIENRTLYNGLELKKITVPFGVLAVIYEARPNVTVDSVGLCLKSGNAAVLRGSSDAVNTNRAIVDVIKRAVSDCKINSDIVELCSCSHDGVKELLSLREYIDLAFPRGSKAFIGFVRDVSLVPTIETGAGNCTCYIHKSADITLAEKVVLNAKTNRISVCNALESLLIDADILEKSLPVLNSLIAAGVTVHGDQNVCNACPGAIPAIDDDYYKEYLSMDISVKTVKNVAEAVDYINKYGTHHSETIVAADKAAIDYFGKYCDSAVIYANASTRFTDGFEFGLGAEIGISTQKLHARGPMGLNELVTYKYIVNGNGQVRS